MPMKPSRICVCGRVVKSGTLCRCQRIYRAEADKRRLSASQRGYGHKWQVESKAFLALPENSHCACGCGRKADMVDHKIPHKGDQKLFWSRSNWQPMAGSPCHNSRKQSLERNTGARNER